MLVITSLQGVMAQQRGKASYYSKRATGARTTSGQRMHHDSLVCAHRTHPFGTRLLVTNLKNHKQVVVKVIDRGPFHRGRVIDLSWAAAKELGMITSGTAVVEVRVYHENKQGPYLPDPDDLPELDFEQTEMESPDSIVPIWQRKPKETTAQQEASESHKNKATVSHASSGNKTTTGPQDHKISAQSQKKSSRKATSSRRKSNWSKTTRRR